MIQRFVVFVLALICACTNPTPPSDSGAPITVDAQTKHLGFGFSQRQVFTAASTSWTAPGGVARVLACGCGAGGGGGGGGGGTLGGAAGGGGGGGGGATWYCYTVAVVPGTAYTVVAATGGAGGTPVSGATGNPGSAGGDSTLQITSSNNLIAHWPGASGGFSGSTPIDGNAAGGRSFATNATGITTSPLASRNVNVYAVGVSLSTRTFSQSFLLEPQAGGAGSTTIGVAAAQGQAALFSFVTGSANSWAGGAAGALGSTSGAGGGGGAGPLGVGAAGRIGLSVASAAGGPGAAAGANTCAGGGGASGGSGGSNNTGGTGGNGGSGEVTIEY